MIKVLEIRTALMTILKAVHSRTFFGVAPDDAIMPYVVVDMPNSVDGDSLENFVLDVDIWDDDQDTTTLETLANSIDTSLHKKTILVTDKVGFVIYRENRLNLTDDDPRIRRRKYVYQLRSFEK